jgi:glycosylphosphatidylinositol transamidase (GPIT) subunit GPI8
MVNHVKYVRSDEVNDIFSYVDKEGEVDYLKFPRTMEMNVNGVEEWLEEWSSK